MDALQQAEASPRAACSIQVWLTLDKPIEQSVGRRPTDIRSRLSRLVGQLGMWNPDLANRRTGLP